jgi:ABC-type multidrug transport system fused ATPase/permease subunit
VAAASAANAQGFIRALPDGYATPIGEGGARLSGGERQRLALARAFLKDAPFLILDEPTSHLDRESESLVLDAASRLMRDRTVLVIAHRPEPVAGSDAIITLRAGMTVGDGRRDAPNGLVAPIAFEGRL